MRARNLFSRSVVVCLLASLAGQLTLSSAAVYGRPARQQKPTRGARRTRPTTPANPQIAKLVKEIDPKNIENTIRKLVSFGTRNTLSEQDNPNRGIGAARDWLYGEFQKAAAT